MRRVELWLGVGLILLVLLMVAASNLDDNGKFGLLVTLGFLTMGLSAIPFDQWRDNRRERADARRRNHVRRS